MSVVKDEVIVPDSTIPQVGSITLKQLGTNTISIKSAGFSDNVGIEGYLIYLDGRQIADVKQSGDLDYTYEVNNPGTFSFSVIAYDAAGNKSDSAFADVTISGETPTSGVTGLKVADNVTEKYGYFSWDPVAESSYEIEIAGDKKTYKSKTNSLTVKKLVAGGAQFRVRAVDKGKNPGEWSEWYDFTVKDITAPKNGKLNLVQLSGNSGVSLSTERFSDNMGIARYDIYLGDQLIDSVGAGSDGQLEYNYLQQDVAGKLNFSVIAYDATGNAGKTVKKAINIKDTTPPGQVEDLSVSVDNGNQSAVLSWGAAEDNVGVVSYEVYVDDKKYTSKTTSLTVKKLAAGEHSVQVYALDKAKNRSDEASTASFSVGGIVEVTGKKFQIGGISDKEYEDLDYGDWPAEAEYDFIQGTPGDDQVIFAANKSRQFNGIDLGAGNDTVELSNGGEVDGLDLGAGDDTVKVGAGCKVDGNMFFGDGNDKLILDGILRIQSDEEVSGLESLSGKGTILCGDHETDEISDTLQSFFAWAQKVGIDVIHTKGDDGFTSRQEEVADNTFANARWMEVDDDEVEMEGWLCEAGKADSLQYGFADGVDYMKFKMTSDYEEIYAYDASIYVPGPEGEVTFTLMDSKQQTLAVFDGDDSTVALSDYNLQNGSVYYIKAEAGAGFIGEYYVSINDRNSCW